MKRYLIHTRTFWTSPINIYCFEAKDDITPFELNQLAYDKAYNDFFELHSIDDIVEEEGIDPSDYEAYEECEKKIDDYIGYSVTEFTGTEDEWNSYEKI